MNAPGLVIVGAGGFGREALDVAQAHIEHFGGYTLLGVVDDNPSETNLGRLQDREIPLLGTVADWMSQVTDPSSVFFIAGVGNPGVRASIARRLEQHGFRAGTVVHPRAVIGSMTKLGEGVVVCSGAQISTNVVLGRHVHVNPNATIGHDAVLQDFVSANPGSIVSGDVMIHDGVLIGAGSVILEGRTVGRGATIGASACVVRDVEAEKVVVGVPAR